MMQRTGLRRTGMRRLTYEEVIAKKQAGTERRKARVAAAPPKVKKPRLKADRVKTLKDKLWTMFSKYIRRSYADKWGMVMTCDGQWKHWKETHCGHLFNNSERSQSLGGNELWYDERNFAPQSSNGNYFNANDSAKLYMLWAVNKYGVEAVEEMRRLKFAERKFTEEELEEKYQHYKREFARIDV